MKRILTVFVTIAFATTFVGNSILGLEACSHNEEEPKEGEVLFAEGLGAVVGGAVVGTGTFILTAYVLWDVVGLKTAGSPHGSIATGLLSLTASYGLGLPLGSALGASSVGGLGKQGGSFWWSWLGAEARAIAAVGLASVVGQVADGAFVIPILALGPPTGAVIGYNVDRLLGGVKPSTALSDECLHDSGPELSLLVPEVELRRDRMSNGFRPRLRRDPTLAYKVTLARLSF